MDTETHTGGKKRRVLAGSIGDCVHSLGVESFAERMKGLWPSNWGRPCPLTTW
jgi:hypothetical protein